MSDSTKKPVVYNNPAEILKDTAREVADVPKAILDEALVQIGLKPQKKAMMGEIDLSSGVHKTNQHIEQKGASLDKKVSQLQSVHKQENEIFNAQKKAIEQQVASLMKELQNEVAKLEAQTAELTQEVRKVTVETAPVNPSVYHLNFFDWVIGTLKDLRKRVSDSRLWLDMWLAKKKQKGYWAMAKKHGQKFQFSDERSVATAAG